MSITNDGAYTTITNSVVETDQSSWGFVDVQTLQASNSNGCRCCKSCREGTGATPCAGCTCNNPRNDGTNGCDSKGCKCDSAVAYVAANSEEFA